MDLLYYLRADPLLLNWPRRQPDPDYPPMRPLRNIPPPPLRPIAIQHLHPNEAFVLPDLQQSSARNVAIALWNRASVNAERGSNENPNEGHCRLPFGPPLAPAPPEYGKLFRDVEELLGKLPVPKSIADYIFSFAENMSKQINDWVGYHKQSSLFNLIHKLPLHSIVENFSWNLDATIDYKKTALNLVQFSTLDTLEKFKLSCLYCLEDQLAELAPEMIAVLVNNRHEPFISSFSPDVLQAYWTYYLKDDLLKLESMLSLVEQNSSSIDSFMFRHEYVSNWCAKEYFFNRLNSEEKVQGAIYMIDRYGSGYQKLVLSRMNESERINVYMQRAVRIMYNYSKDKKYTREILSTWLEIRNLIEPDQFVSIINDLLRWRKCDSILTGIWASVCDDFKERVLNFNVEEIMEKIFHIMKEDDNDGASEFLFAILPDIDDSTKKTIISKPFFRTYCDVLFEKREFPRFEQLIKKFVQVRELEQCRRDIIQNSTAVKNTCFEWYSTGEVEVLNHFLNDLLPLASPDFIQELKKNLLMSTDIIEKFANRLEQTWNVLEVIFADGLPDEHLQAEFKKRLVFSSRGSSVLRSWLVRDRFPCVRHYVDYFLSSEEDRKKLRKHLLMDSKREDLAIIFCNYGHDLAKIEEMLYWCLEDDQGLRQYKSSQDVDAVFDWLLNDAVFQYRRPKRVTLPNCFSREKPDFSGLELFLNWYFKSPCEVKHYKLKRIESYGEIPTLKTLIEKSRERRFKLKHVIRWLFDNDREQMEEFKRKLSSEDDLFEASLKV